QGVAEVFATNNDVHQFLGQVAVDLEKRPGTDPVGSKSCRISKVISTPDHDPLEICSSFSVAAASLKKHGAVSLGQCGPEVGGELFCGVRDFSQAMNL